MSNVCEECRKMNNKLMLRGERCLSMKCAMVKKPYAPGAHGQTDTRSKKSEYGRQLQEKQKAREIYGMREGQFRSYVERAEKMQGNSAENLLKLLELRLDNVVYRLGLATSRPHARQMVSHGLIRVNDKKVNIPSYVVKIGDMVAPKNIDRYKEINANGVPAWLDLNAKTVSGSVKRIPLREEIDTPISESMIIEFYSR